MSRFFLLLPALACIVLTGCQKAENIRPVTSDDLLSCTNCTVKGYLYATDTKLPLANKAIALSLSDYGKQTENDIYTVTDENGFFQLRYTAVDSSLQICLYPRPKNYDAGKSYECIVGALPMGRHLLMDRIYTSAEFE